MDDITKSLRDLIRITMRERGIKHKSTTYEITSICYAQRPLTSIEFLGPIKIICDLERAVLIVEVYSSEENAIKDAQYFPNSTIGCNEYEVVALTAKYTIEIARPDMTDVLGAILDKHVPDSIKQPMPHKKLISKPYKFYVSSTTSVKSRRPFFQKCKDVVLSIFNVDINNQDFYWEQAIKRHFRADSKELNEIRQTVSHLRNLSHSRIQNDTEEILRQ